MAQPPQQEAAAAAAQPPQQDKAAAKTPLQVALVQSKQPERLKFIILVALVFVSLAGLTVAIIWIPCLPKKLEYSVERASIRGFNISADGNLTASLAIVVRAVNPHRDGYSFYYQRIDAAALYQGQEIISSGGAVPPFYQPKRNATDLNLNLAASYPRPVNGSVARDLKAERAAGSLDLGVKIRAKMLLKLGALKIIHRTLKVSCGPMKIPFPSSSRKFERVVCHTQMSG